jgi:hypothetical protein
MTDNATGIDPAKMYVPSEVAPILGYSPRSVQRLAATGVIKSQRIGNRLKISGINLLEFINRVDNQPAADAS